MWTILGSSGFIGRYLTYELKKQKNEVYTPDRKEIKKIKNKNLDIVAYCIGETTEFKKNIANTFYSNFILLKEILENNRCNQIIYLSSTRIYKNNQNTDENIDLNIKTYNIDDTYNISKIAAESYLLNCKKNVKCLRLSNVYSYEAGEKNNFLNSILQQAVMFNKVKFLTTRKSQKDYISIKDVVHYITKISEINGNEIFNIAYGKNFSNSQIEYLLKNKGVEVEYDKMAYDYIYPQINNNKIATMCGECKNSINYDFDKIFETYKFKFNRSKLCHLKS